MELFFRKYFWTVNVVFVLAVAFIAARTVNLFVEGRVAPVAVSGVPASLTKHTTTELVTLSPEGLARLTKLKLPAPIEPVAGGGERFDPNAAPVKSSLRLKLLGTLVASPEEWSVASIQDADNQKVSTFMVGDLIKAATILEIERSRVIIRNGQRKEYINGEAGDGIATASIAPPIKTTESVKEPTLGANVKEVSENNYEVPRGDIDKALANMGDLAMAARIVPAFKDGVSQGFKIFSIRPDSFYSKIGVVNGDVIKRINGYDMNSPEKALELYTKLKDAGRVDIELDRNGSNLHKTYNIR